MYTLKFTVLFILLYKDLKILSYLKKYKPPFIFYSELHTIVYIYCYIQFAVYYTVHCAVYYNLYCTLYYTHMSKGLAKLDFTKCLFTVKWTPDLWSEALTLLKKKNYFLNEGWTKWTKSTQVQIMRKKIPHTGDNNSLDR